MLATGTWFRIAILLVIAALLFGVEAVPPGWRLVVSLATAALGAGLLVVLARQGGVATRRERLRRRRIFWR